MDRDAGERADLSVVIVTPGGVDEVAHTIGCLLAQTARHRIELVVVGPAVEGARTEDLPDSGFAAARFVRMELESTGGALAAGVRAARASLVAVAEEHSYPEHGWAQALIEAHRGPWAAVGGSLENANPRTWRSWAHLFTDFGPAVAPVPSGEVDELPGHHTAYKRDVLLRYGDRLDRCLEMEWVVHEDLKLAGERLYLAEGAVSRHVNVSRAASHLRSEFLGGRTFAATRAWMRRWSPLRRLVYIAGSPLLPAVRLYRVLRHVRRAHPELLPSLLPTLTVGLVANSVGQAVGYAFGRGAATRRRLGIELRRESHVAEVDRRTPV